MFMIGNQSRQTGEALPTTVYSVHLQWGGHPQWSFCILLFASKGNPRGRESGGPTALQCSCPPHRSHRTQHIYLHAAAKASVYFCLFCV